MWQSVSCVLVLLFGLSASVPPAARSVSHGSGLRAALVAGLMQPDHAERCLISAIHRGPRATPTRRHTGGPAVAEATPVVAGSESARLAVSPTAALRWPVAEGNGICATRAPPRADRRSIHSG